MLVLISIYLISTMLMWLFVAFYVKTSKSGDLIITFIPVFNSLAVFIAIIYMIVDIDWDKVANKIFLINNKN